MKAENVTDSPIVHAAATMPFARAMATTTASKHQAVTSSTAAQAIAIEPTRDWVSPRSVRIRAKTGNAVTLMAVPKNSPNGKNETPLGA